MTTTSAGLYGQPQRATAARLADGAAFPPIPSGRRIRSITIIFDEGQDNPTPVSRGRPSFARLRQSILGV